jgi:hypothetical protein
VEIDDPLRLLRLIGEWNAAAGAIHAAAFFCFYTGATPASFEAFYRLSNAASNDTWSTGNLNAAGLAAVNKTGTTQLRVSFNLDDNDDTGNDYLGYYSGENNTAANRPQLVVTYQ